MPLFSFHLYKDVVTMDDEGQDLADVAAARNVALRPVREPMCEEVRKGRLTLGHRIDIEDAGHKPAFTLTYRGAVGIMP